jgi:hypothetical protein
MARIPSARLCSIAIVAGLVSFVGLTALAALAYPGGTYCEPDADRYRFWGNFFCDLTAPLTRKGIDTGAGPARVPARPACRPPRCEAGERNGRPCRVARRIGRCDWLRSRRRDRDPLRALAARTAEGGSHPFAGLDVLGCRRWKQRTSVIFIGRLAFATHLASDCVRLRVSMRLPAIGRATVHARQVGLRAHPIRARHRSSSQLPAKPRCGTSLEGSKG